MKKIITGICTLTLLLAGTSAFAKVTKTNTHYRRTKDRTADQRLRRTNTQRRNRIKRRIALHQAIHAAIEDLMKKVPAEAAHIDRSHVKTGMFSYAGSRTYAAELYREKAHQAIDKNNLHIEEAAQGDYSFSLYKLDQKSNELVAQVETMREEDKQNIPPRVNERIIDTFDELRAKEVKHHDEIEQSILERDVMDEFALQTEINRHCDVLDSINKTEIQTRQAIRHVFTSKQALELEMLGEEFDEAALEIDGGKIGTSNRPGWPSSSQINNDLNQLVDEYNQLQKEKETKGE